MGKLNHSAGSKPHYAAILKFHFSPSVIAGLEFYAFGDGQIEKCLFETLAGIAVNLNIAIDTAQAHNPHLRIGET